MGILKKTTLKIAVFSLILLSCNRNGSNFNKNRYICIYKYNLNNMTKAKPILTAIAMIDDELYYFAQDSMLMAYKQLPLSSAKKIDDKEFLKILQTLNINSLQSLSLKKDYLNCSCLPQTIEEFVISKSSKSRLIGFAISGGFANCSADSKCKILEIISKKFAEIEGL